MCQIQNVKRDIQRYYMYLRIVKHCTYFDQNTGAIDINTLFIRNSYDLYVVVYVCMYLRTYKYQQLGECFTNYNTYKSYERKSAVPYFGGYSYAIGHLFFGLKSLEKYNKE